MHSNESGNVTFGGTLTFKEFKQYNMYHSKRITLFYFLISFVFLTWVFETIYPYLLLEFSLLFSLVISLVLTLIFRLMIVLRSRKEFNSDRLIKNDIWYVANEEGINQKIRRSNTQFLWEDILSAYEHEDLFRVYISKNKAIVIPKRYFDSKEDIGNFKDLIRQNLGSKKVKLL